MQQELLRQGRLGPFHSAETHPDAVAFVTVSASGWQSGSHQLHGHDLHGPAVAAGYCVSWSSAALLSSSCINKLSQIAKRSSVPRGGHLHSVIDSMRLLPVPSARQQTQDTSARQYWIRHDPPASPLATFLLYSPGQIICRC